ncbi:hypothetical protein BKI52_44865 [marine bacterium AO1-C]|nr:hypothetical protein BKI52_44865 [marine bacterium AO1-C]
MSFKWIHIFFGLIFTSCVFSVQAQTGTTNSDSLLVLARDYAKKGVLEKSLRHYWQVLRSLQQQKDTKLLAKVQVEVGELYQSVQLYQKSLEYFKKADSIKTLQNDPTGKADVLAHIGLAYQQSGKYREALTYYDQQAQIYQQNKQKAATVVPYRKMVECHQSLEEYNKVLEYNQKILALMQESGNKKAEIISLNNIGFAYKYLKNYPEALRNFKASLNAQRATGQATEKEIPTRVNIAVIYQNQGRYDESIALLLQTIKIAEAANKISEQAQLYDLLSVVYFNQKDYYNAEQYNKLAIATAQKINDQNTLQRAYETASFIYQAQDDFKEALDSYKKHLKIKETLQFEVIKRQQQLANQESMLERNEKQINLLLADQENRELLLRNRDLELKAKQKQLELLAKEKDIQDAKLKQEALAKQQALQSLQLAVQKANAAQKDKEIYQLQVDKKQKEQQLRLKALAEEEKRKQIQLLEKDKKIKALDIQRQKEELDRQKQIGMYALGVFALGALVFILILFGLFSVLRSRRKLSKQKDEIEEKNVELFQVNEEIAAQRDLLEVKNVEIENINHDLTASITYAQRIQEAMLPSVSRIQAYLPESFVLFKPRDIVSGDFYWFAKIKSTEKREQLEEAYATKMSQSLQMDTHSSKLILAAVDCTGHGVPGALMSMTGSNLLNEIVEMRGTDRPEYILRQLHRGVKKALKQDETNNRDGMDMALCVIDVEKQVVQFAGAKNPLIVIQNGELREIKGDKMPIGGEWGKEEGERLFTGHKILLEEKPTSFYMFSDGYQDQFGGPAGKKFMKGHLKKLLLEIHKKPMEEQKQILDEAITQWMAQSGPDAKVESQIDDILVMGFKVNSSKI